MNIIKISKAIIVFGVVCAVVLGGGFVYLKTQKKETRPVFKFKPIATVMVDKEDWIKDLPKGLFAISDSKDIDSAFSSNANENYSQKSARYLSTKNFEQTTKFFRDYFDRNDWIKMTESTPDDQSYASFMYKKENTTVLVTINNKPDGSVPVYLNINTKI